MAAGAIVWRSGWLDGQPVPAPHPLASLDPSEIVAVARLEPGGARPLSDEERRRAAVVITSLDRAPLIDSRTVVWGSAAAWQAVTRDGVVLSLQIKPIDGGAAVRVTADPAPGRAPAASAEAAAIRALRLNAYRLSPDAAAPFLR